MNNETPSRKESEPYYQWSEEITHHEITFQGTYCEWRVVKKTTQFENAKRGSFTSFSKGARLRMLKIFNRLDWENIDYSLFVTATYPDEVIVTHHKQSTMHRSVFWRFIEKEVGKNVCGIWRMEWMPRKSGLHVGQYWPHMHFLLFGVRYIHYEKVNDFWKRSIHVEEVRTDVKACTGKLGAAWYVAKYCGKPVNCSLVIDANLNKVTRGKQWGIMRRDLLPFAQKYTVRVPPGDLAATARQYVHDMRQGKNTIGDESFTILGDLTGILRDYLLGRLDNGDGVAVEF